MQQYLVLLRCNRNYLYLWLGSVITQLGDWFNLLASAELLTQLTSSGVAISYLFLARFLPLFLFSPFAGVLADRYDRRRIMIATDLLRAGTVLCFLLIRDPAQVWLFYLLTATQFTLSALFTPARTAVLANIVPRKDLVTANALDSLTWSTMLALGAFLGGIVAAIFGLETAFIMDAATFLLSAWIVSRISVESRHPGIMDASRGWRQGWLEFAEGFRYLLGVPFILGVSLAKGAGSLVWGGINVLEITFANQVFPLDHVALMDFLRIKDAGTATLGIIFVVSGLGTGLGPLFLRRLLGDAYARLLAGITAGFTLLSAGIIALGLAPTFPLFLLATLVRTVGSGVIWVFSAALLQMLVPDHYRGRVFAFEFAVLTLTQSLSTYGAGFMLDQWGFSVQNVALSLGLLGIGVNLLWLFFLLGSRKWVRELPEFR